MAGVSCAHHTDAPPASGPALFSGPIPIQPVTDPSLANIEAGFLIDGNGDNPSLVFCTERYAKDAAEAPSFHPVILRTAKGGWEKLDFNKEPFADGMAWIAVHESPKAKKIWAIAQWMRGDPGETLEVVLSEDAGWTWTRAASIKKPWYMAELQSFRMDPDGRGMIVLNIANDAAGPEESIGYWRSHTNDWGKTWTSPRLEERDSLEPVETLSREQPLPELLKKVSAKRR